MKEEQMVEMARDLLKAKEQNRLIELPVPFGEICYKVTLDINYEWRIFSTVFDLDLFVDEYLENKDLFCATREEAEKKLNELRGMK